MKNIYKWIIIFNTLGIKNFKFKILVFQKPISKSKTGSGKSKKKNDLPVISTFNFNIFFGFDLEHT